MTVWRGITGGFVGGLVAAGAMSLVHNAIGGILLETPRRSPSGDQKSDEDATKKVADSIARRLLGRSLRDDDKPLAGNVVH